MDKLAWLQEWYYKYCDGDWEHQERIKITTLDNPGWYILINLKETELETKNFNSLIIERSDNDWIHCNVKNSLFTVAGGPRNLDEMLSIFYNWVTMN